MQVEQLVENMKKKKFKKIKCRKERKKYINRKENNRLKYPNVGDKYILFLMDSNLVENAYDR